MKPEIKAERLVSFLEETIAYFMNKIEKIDRDRYFADRDSRSILDKRACCTNPKIALRQAQGERVMC
ncbi:MAG: hypothetical protein A2Z47_14325 [Thermodesulfovibrio sp. RBG_19FT_COMBO_42_12]|nr:MAG: hypothetical protein A2Z47_14325 [Thermodesulfovibrio sp. RBG_19FT_COMBO_42_12]